MPVVEELKRIVEKLTGIGRPPRRELGRLARPPAPQLFRFRDDGETPNNPLPLVVYRRALRLDEAFDPAAIFEETFARHGWRKSWRDGIYDFRHFHTATHEVLGNAVVLPAGTGHRRIKASADLLVVGAYPAAGRYDQPRPAEVDHAAAVASIAKVKLPRRDPVYGAQGPLLELWKNPPMRRRAARRKRAKRA
jgi:uncharacterized protein YjlB